jgi:ubiquinone/menaquinone biosynthesis C-methylase UbiE
MRRPARGFDRLAPWYRAAEILAFGRDLEEARFEHLGRLAGAPRILLLGEGDGRCAERVAALHPGASILCVDSSPGMVARATRRLAGTAAAGRVRFACADARTFDPGPERFEAVATLFFLDCFRPDEVAGLAERLDGVLTAEATWLFADFVLPPAGWRRWRARAWVALLYAFFRWETGLAVRRLPPSEEILAARGWRRCACRDRQAGLLRSAVFQRSGPAA